MAIIHIDTKDPRSLKALQILAGCDRWSEMSGIPGTFRIPSQAKSYTRYVTAADCCTCIDWMRHQPQACKHMVAVQIHLALRELAS